MINKNTQINSGFSRVDFSHIRKAASGMQIPMYQASTTKGGIGYVDGTSWRENIYKNFSNKLYELLKAAKDSGTLNNLVSQINNMQDRYANLRAKYPDIEHVTLSDEVAQYQKDIQQNYNFVNTAGIGGEGGGDLRYVRKGEGHLNGNIDAAGEDNSWENSNDGYWGGMTQDRTILGYGDDWDETSLNAENEKLKQYGYKLAKAENGSYHLVPLTNTTNTVVEEQSTVVDPASNQNPEEQSTVVNGGSSSGGSKDATYDDFKYKPNAFTPPYYYGAATGVGIGNVIKNLNLEEQQKVSLQQAPYRQYEVTDDYASQVAANNQAAKYRNTANRNLSSSLEANNLNNLLYEEQAAKMELEGQLQKNNAYNNSIQKANEIDYTNKYYATQAANANRQNLIANQNAILAEKEKANNTIATALQKDIVGLSNELGKHKYQEKINKDYEQTQHYNTKLAQEQNEALKPYTDLYNNPMTSNAFITAFNKAISELDPNSEYDALFTQDNKMLDEETQKKNLYKYITENPDSEIAKSFNSDFKTELEDKYKVLSPELDLIKQRYQDLIPQMPFIYSTNGYYNPYLYKKGGKVSKTVKIDEKDRMIKYIEHNRKVSKQIDDNVYRATKLMQDQLKRNLDALDKETLLLLRSIFK